MRFTRRSGLPIAIIVLATTLTAGAEAPAPAGTADDREWEAPVLVSHSHAARETSLALSPTDPDLMFLCDPSGVPNTSRSQSHFHLSRTGGASWQLADVEPDSDDLRNYAFEGGDCDVAFDEGGTMYTADTWLGNLSVGHSRDGGQTWSGTPITTSTVIVDRPWLVGGPEGTVYLSYQDLQCCTVSAIFFTVSTDYGATFRPAIPVTTANADGAFTWEGNFVVREGGEDIFLVYTRRSAAPASNIDGNYPEQVYVAASHDGGLTWTSHLITETDRPASFLYPSIALGPDDRLHVVYSSSRGADRPVWYATSDDDAKTWTEPVPLTDNTAGVAPWIVTDADGDALIHWLGSTDALATTSTESPWYFYWARVSEDDAGTRTIASGTTTHDPLFVGRQTMPEFNQLRVDADGMVHIGASIFRKRESGGNGWAIYYQRERLEPPTP